MLKSKMLGMYISGRDKGDALEKLHSRSLSKDQSSMMNLDSMKAEYEICLIKGRDMRGSLIS